MLSEQDRQKLVALIHDELEAIEAQRLSLRLSVEDDLRTEYEALLAADDQLHELFRMPAPHQDLDPKQAQKIMQRAQDLSERKRPRWLLASVGAAVAAGLTLILLHREQEDLLKSLKPRADLAGGEVASENAGSGAMDLSEASQQAKFNLAEVISANAKRATGIKSGSLAKGQNLAELRPATADVAASQIEVTTDSALAVAEVSDRPAGADSGITSESAPAAPNTIASTAALGGAPSGGAPSGGAPSGGAPDGGPPYGDGAAGDRTTMANRAEEPPQLKMDAGFGQAPRAAAKSKSSEPRQQTSLSASPSNRQGVRLTQAAHTGVLARFDLKTGDRLLSYNGKVFYDQRDVDHFEKLWVDGKLASVRLVIERAGRRIELVRRFNPGN